MSKQNQEKEIIENLVQMAVNHMNISEKAARLRIEAIVKSGILGKFGHPNEATFQIAIDAAMQIPQLGEDESEELHRTQTQKRIDNTPSGLKGSYSDGYHTFNELYEFRKIYNAALFNEWAKHEQYDVHKSWKHHDGELCFGGGWFIVVAVLPSGQISNHYKAEDWDLFKIPATERAKYEFDGHTSEDVLSRLKLL